MDDADFLAEICAHPEDNVRRLVYADMLEDRGDPRGEFIRLQVLLEKEPDPAAEERMEELLLAHEAEWVASIRPHVLTWTFMRGFVEYIDVETSSFVEHHRAIMQWPIRFATFRRSYRLIGEVTETGVLEQLQGLCFDDNTFAPEDLVAFGETAEMPELRRLSLSDCHLVDGHLRDLASMHAPRLTILDLSYNRLRNDGVRTLCGSDLVTDLTHLVLMSNEIRLMGARTLAATARLGKLEYLDVRDNPFDRRAVDLLRDRFGTGVMV